MVKGDNATKMRKYKRILVSYNPTNRWVVAAINKENDAKNGGAE